MTGLARSLGYAGAGALAGVVGLVVGRCNGGSCGSCLSCAIPAVGAVLLGVLGRLPGHARSARPPLRKVGRDGTPSQTATEQEGAMGGEKQTKERGDGEMVTGLGRSS